MINYYFIYLGTGGITHMLTGISLSIKKSIEYKRQCVILTERHSGYRRKFSEYFDISLNEFKYFESLKSLENLEIYKKYEKYLNGQIKFIDRKYCIEDLDITDIEGQRQKNNEIIIFSRYSGVEQEYMKYIKCKKDILREIEIKYKLNKKLRNKYLSVHFRNTDMKNDIKKFVGKTVESCKKYKIKYVYLATDDFNAYNVFEKELKKIDVEIVQLTKPIELTGNKKNVHYGNLDKDELIMNYLLDLYSVLKSSYFVPSINSSLSQWLVRMIKEEINLFDVKNKVLII